MVKKEKLHWYGIDNYRSYGISIHCMIVLTGFISNYNRISLNRQNILLISRLNSNRDVSLKCAEYNSKYVLIFGIINLF